MGSNFLSLRVLSWIIAWGTTEFCKTWKNCMEYSLRETKTNYTRDLWTRQTSWGYDKIKKCLSSEIHPLVYTELSVPFKHKDGKFIPPAEGTAQS